MPESPGGPPAPRRFRWEIEGLRAVAALLVAAYHVWFGRVSGGVDVFFVVAGFMVTTTLLGHLERTGRIDAGRYLGRLLKRLLPNALLVLGVVALATWWLIPSTRRDEVFSEIAASALYYENWALAARSVDYLQRDYTNSPVQHFWAMSIQGQFYLIWLVLFVLALRVGSPATARRRLGLVMGALTLGSLAFSVWFTGVDQPVAYFHTGARVWEFGAGGLMALSAPWWPVLSRRWSFGLGWVGLLAVLSCGALLSVGTSFPGWVALWPVTGAVLILLAGHTDSRWSASTLLSSRPLVQLGSVSYALYLWHWPLLVFVLVLTQRDRVGALGGLAVIAVAIALSFVSTHLVERPVRSLSVERRRAWGVPLLAALLVGPFAGTAYVVAAQSEQTGVVQTDLEPEVYPGARDATGTNSAGSLTSSNTQTPAPGIDSASEDIPAVYAQGCHQAQDVDEVASCEYGDPGAERTMILVGGSHSAHWQPPLQVIAEQRGWRLLSATKSGCRPGTHLAGDAGEAGGGATAQQESCRAWNAASLEWIAEQDPDLVVLTSTVGKGDEEAVPTAYLRVWEELARDDIPVLAIRETPRSGQDMVDCLAANGPLTRECDLNRDRVLSPVDPTSLLDPAPEGVSFADLSDSLCDARVCPPVIGNIIVYSDNSHLTTTYSRTLAQALLDAAPVLR
ncbi:MAG: acyltransferase family protein [Ornithinimicrobium sp.]|uniref:acyltransferase family protein n=1 Tax=Ornithinimicrobium sp. TaxID=1977084 RepID=UPI003D9B69AB